MQRLFVGTIYASIESPAGLDADGRARYANAFLRMLETRINERNDGIRVEFTLISAERGCVKVRAAIVAFIASAAAALLLLENPETLRIASYLASSVQTNFKCVVGGDEFACKLLKCNISQAKKYHLTSEGDTLEVVLRDVFNVKPAEMPSALARMKLWHSGALKHPESSELKAGYLLAYLEPGMCIQAEPVRSVVAQQ